MPRPLCDYDRALSHEVGDRIRTARHAAGLTLSDLAKGTGYAITSIQQVEQGVYRPTLGLIYRAAEVLGVSPLALLPRPKSTARAAQTVKGRASA